MQWNTSTGAFYRLETFSYCVHKVFQDPFNVCMWFNLRGIKSCFCAYMFIFGNLLIQLKVILTFNDSNKDGWVLRVWISNSRLYCIDIREHLADVISARVTVLMEKLWVFMLWSFALVDRLFRGVALTSCQRVQKMSTSHCMRTVPACVDHLNSVRATHSLGWHNSTRRTIMTSQVGCVCWYARNRSAV